MDAVASANLEKPLLVRDSDSTHISVNFDPEVSSKQHMNIYKSALLCIFMNIHDFPYEYCSSLMNIHEGTVCVS